MRLLVAHKILIGSSIALATVLVVTRALRWSAGHHPADLWMACGAAAAIPLLSIYLRKIWNR
jgi:hypothetical protein